MEDWKQLEIKDVTFIEKCVAEFNVGELVKTPYSKFKVKIFEKQDGTFIGFTNLQLKDKEGSPFPGVGYGDTVEKALADTINYFFAMIDEKENLCDEDFECVDPYDF
jgi:hypothetical protein